MCRTKTYIAGDWTGDRDLISKLIEWNKSDNYNLHFSDVHTKIQARDTSLYCSIKKSLAARLDMSKTFVLIVGKKTDLLTKGSCQYCSRYSAYFTRCYSGGNVDYRSYIEFESQKAKRDGLKIVIIYNYLNVCRDKCPECLRYVGTHISAYHLAVDGRQHWNYSEIKKAIIDDRSSTNRCLWQGDRIKTTNIIEGFNRPLRKLRKAKSVFPTDESLLKMLHLDMMDITKKWNGRRQG